MSGIPSGLFAAPGCSTRLAAIGALLMRMNHEAAASFCCCSRTPADAMVCGDWRAHHRDAVPS